MVIGKDLDSDGMDDRLQRIIAGQRESEPFPRLIGLDGRPTVAIVVDYAGTLDPVIPLHLEKFSNPQVEEEGSWFFEMDIPDSIVLDHVPVSALIEIWQLDGVVMVEEQNVIVPFLDTAT